MYWNREHRALICVLCKGAVCPAAFVKHLRGKHHVEWEVFKRVEGYIKGFGHDCKRSTMTLPDDWSAPQPVLPIYDGFKCVRCEFQCSRSSDDSRVRWEHGITEHGLK